MKKLLMFLCCVFAINATWAGCNSPVTLAYQGNQRPHDNEFLYLSKAEYDDSVSGYKNTRNSSGDGKGYECDATFSGSCTSNDTVVMPAGHVFKGEVINRRVKYKCATLNTNFNGPMLGDRWVAIEDEDYCDTPEFGKIGIGQCVSSNGRCRELSKIDCGGYDKTDEENGTVYNGLCQAGPRFICKAIKCVDGMEPDSNGKCVTKKQDPQKKSCDGTAHGKTKTENCPSSIPNGNQCSRTCNDGKWSNWKLVSCKAGYKKQGEKCVKATTPAPTPAPNPAPNPDPAPIVIPEEPFTCPEFMPSDWRTVYADCPEVIAAYEELMTYCISDSNRNQNGYDQRILRLEALRKICEDKAEAQRNRTSQFRATISGAVAELEKLTSSLKASVWKTSEGNFNGARLASDSIAGVVLGTAGGLITSHLVKKNQVKTGFEDIQCAVGGQKVADWGDEFMVGIR